MNKSRVPIRRAEPGGPEHAADKIRQITVLRPSLAVVLGSGFDHVLGHLTVDASVSYSEIPGFPCSSVPGHAGELVAARAGDVPVLILSGRVHFYEGHDLDRVTFAIRSLGAFGIRDLLLTNAAGGVNRKYRPGHFMVLTDHINFMGVNPLRGPAIAGLPRFVDLTQTYDPHLSGLLYRSARKAGLRAHKGVYLAVSGPSYETPAEIRAFRYLGADAVGMSTVPEAIVARQLGMRVAAISCITNQAAGTTPKPLSHQEVLDTARRVRKPAALLLKHFITNYARPE